MSNTQTLHNKYKIRDTPTHQIRCRTLKWLLMIRMRPRSKSAARLKANLRGFVRRKKRTEEIQSREWSLNEAGWCCCFNKIWFWWIYWVVELLSLFSSWSSIHSPFINILTLSNWLCIEIWNWSQRHIMRLMSRDSEMAVKLIRK